MKKLFLNCCLKCIKENKPEINDEKLDEIRYGLEGLYLTITKTIVIFLLSWILGIFKEMLLLLLFFNILRTTAFGIHAKKSWMCWISSIIIFIFLPFLAKIIVIPFYIKLILGIISIIEIYLYAPADTYKHPLVNKNKREIWKFISTINCIIMIIISLFVANNIISNLLLFSTIVEITMIHPISYKIFNLPYNNYKNYNLGY